MRLRCGQPFRMWLSSPAGTFRAYRRCILARLRVITRVDKAEAHQYASNPRHYGERGRKVQPKAEERL